MSTNTEHSIDGVKVSVFASSVFGARKRL